MSSLMKSAVSSVEVPSVHANHSLSHEAAVHETLDHHACNGEVLENRDCMDHRDMMGRVEAVCRHSGHKWEDLVAVLEMMEVEALDHA